MSSSLETAPVESTNWTRAELYEHYELVFYAVAKEYARLRALSPVVASIVDPDGIGKSTKLTFDSVNYAVDIERATEKALESRLDLQAAWFCLALDEPVNPKLARDTITQCGRIYSARKLAPWHYHKPNKYPQKQGAR
jgi:hypothetical protein